MEIHFYDSQLSVPANVDVCYGWVDTIRAFHNGVEIIHTTQMGLLTTAWFDFGYKIFVHPYDNAPYEIKIGENNCTQRKIRMEHNLFNLWEAGDFT